MKKILMLLTLTLTPLCLYTAQPQISKESQEEKIEKSVKQLDQHLREAILNPNERNILINKLKGYFSQQPGRTNLLLKNKQSQLIYSTIIKSYNDILGDHPKGSPIQKETANKFAERALGKILLSQTQKKKSEPKRTKIIIKKP